MDPWSVDDDDVHKSGVGRADRADRADRGADRGLDAGVHASGRALLCVSDVHGDLAALDSVLDATAHLDLCAVVAAGDHCLGGPDPFGVWQRLVGISAHMVRGPSDLALGMLRVRDMSPRNAREEVRLVTFLRTQQALGDVVCRRLAELPSTLVVSLDDKSGVMVMHGSPSDEYGGLVDDEHLAHEVDCIAEDVLVCGSTHRGFIRRLDRRVDPAGTPLLVVNCGSVGVSPIRSDANGRTAHAVLIVPCSDGVVRAFPKDVPIAASERVRRAG